MEFFRFGVVSDIQYANINDAPNFSGRKIRKYRSAVDALRLSIHDFNTHNVPFVLQLGDIIDGQNSGTYGALKGKPPCSEEALTSVMKEFEKLKDEIKVYHSIGNHELYNFTWSQLSSHLNLENKHQVSVEDRFYFAFSPHPKWRIITLNTYEITVMQDKVSPEFDEAKKFLQINPNFNDFMPHFDPDFGEVKEVDYFQDLPLEDYRYVPFNGGVSKTQLEWLRKEIEVCKESGVKVIVTTHIPLLAVAGDIKCVVFNAEEILKVFEENEGVVKAVFAGHSHGGGFHFDEKLGISHVTFKSSLEKDGKPCHAIVKVMEEKIIIDQSIEPKSRVLKI